MMYAGFLFMRLAMLSFCCKGTFYSQYMQVLSPITVGQYKNTSDIVALAEIENRVKSKKYPIAVHTMHTGRSGMSETCARDVHL